MNATHQDAHSQLVQGWLPQSIPEGYDRIVLCEYGFTRELNYLNNDADIFYSEVAGKAAPIQWPWKEGFDPQALDWKMIDVLVIDFCNGATK